MQRAYQKEKIESNKQRKESNQNKFVEKGGIPDIVKSFGEVDGSVNRTRTCPGLVKTIRNGPRKIKNLIEGKPPRQKRAWRGKRMELYSRKKSRRNRMMLSESV